MNITGISIRMRQYPLEKRGYNDIRRGRGPEALISKVDPLSWKRLQDSSNTWKMTLATEGHIFSLGQLPRTKIN